MKRIGVIVAIETDSIFAHYRHLILTYKFLYFLPIVLIQIILINICHQHEVADFVCKT